MYYFLTLIGIILIVVGKSHSESVLVAETTLEPEEFGDLIKRIEALERTLYDVDFNFEEEEIKLLETTYETVDTTTNTAEKPITIFETLRQCEEEGYSLEKTCSILNMNKGEVLLLKNLYKNYQG